MTHGPPPDCRRLVAQATLHRLLRGLASRHGEPIRTAYRTDSLLAGGNGMDALQSICMASGTTPRCSHSPGAAATVRALQPQSGRCRHGCRPWHSTRLLTAGFTGHNGGPDPLEILEFFYRPIDGVLGITRTPPLLSRGSRGRGRACPQHGKTRTRAPAASPKRLPIFRFGLRFSDNWLRFSDNWLRFSDNWLRFSDNWLRIGRFWRCQAAPAGHSCRAQLQGTLCPTAAARSRHAPGHRPSGPGIRIRVSRAQLQARLSSPQPRHTPAGGRLALQARSRHTCRARCAPQAAAHACLVATALQGTAAGTLSSPQPRHTFADSRPLALQGTLSSPQPRHTFADSRPLALQARCHPHSRGNTPAGGRLALQARSRHTCRARLCPTGRGTRLLVATALQGTAAGTLSSPQPRHTPAGGRLSAAGTLQAHLQGTLCPTGRGTRLLVATALQGTAAGTLSSPQPRHTFADSRPLALQARCHPPQPRQHVC